jgi:hypothetical protein
MTKANFIFTQYHNSFSVHVSNLEKLSVGEIQKIESFVKMRKGIFDFQTYTFVIQKRLEFHEFVSLIQKTDIQANCHENIIVKEVQARVSFGQYKGMFYSELPDSYMLWLKTNYHGKDRESIEKELQKRNL